MFSYAPLIATLHKRKVSKSELQSLIGASSTTIAKIGKDQFISMKVLSEICNVLQCKIEDVIEFVPDKQK